MIKCLFQVPITPHLVDSIRTSLNTGQGLTRRQRIAINALLGTTCSIVISSRVEPVTRDAVLTDEMAYTRVMLNCYYANLHQQLDNLAAAIDVDAERPVQQYECGCCYTECPVADMLACHGEGHLFCQACIEAYANTQIFDNASLGYDKESKRPVYELMCMHGDGCTSKFDQATLERCLPPKTLKKYAELQSDLCIRSSGLQDVYSCYKCGFKIVIETQHDVFTCPLPACGCTTCRLCAEKAHPGRKCGETEEEEAGRHTVEEAMSKAVIRKCPTCQKPFLKLGGCNKIRCGC